MSTREIQPERGAQYSVHDDGSITYFDEPTPELRAEAEQAARELRGGQKDQGDDGDSTRDELYEKAQELDIPGRSTMSKDELGDAVRNAEEDDDARS